MNTWKKCADGSWAIDCEVPIEPGTEVEVRRRNGTSSTEVLGELIYAVGDHHVYAVATPAKPKPEAVKVGAMDGIMRLFDAADRSKLRKPSIVLYIEGTGAVELKRARPGTRAPGSIDVATPGWGNTWFGRVRTTGEFEPSPRCQQPAGLTEILTAFAAEPLKVAREHGRKTGLCCFCNSRLHDERSTELGYGPGCAKRWGLEYGVKAARRAAAEFAAEAA